MVSELFVATYLKDWGRSATFANRAGLDMTCAVGGQPIDMTPQAIADPWAVVSVR